MKAPMPTMMRTLTRDMPRRRRRTTTTTKTMTMATRLRNMLGMTH